MSGKRPNKTYVVISDTHFDTEHREAIQLFLKTLPVIKPDGLILLGDIAEAQFMSPHVRKKKPYNQWDETQMYEACKPEFDALNTFLDKLHKLCPKAEKIFAYGNHDFNYTKYIQENPKAREHLFNLEKQLRLKERGYKVYGYNEPFKVGKLTYVHGTYHGANHGKKHVEAFANDIIYGHLHQAGIYALKTVGKHTRHAYANPCLRSLDPAWMRGTPTNWSLGFTIVYYFKNGDFQVCPIIFSGKKCVVNGKVVKL